jgi:hypothetical protein
MGWVTPYRPTDKQKIAMYRRILKVRRLKLHEYREFQQLTGLDRPEEIK